MPASYLPYLPDQDMLLPHSMREWLPEGHLANRWGVMSGTSMATPIATGVLARRLAASPSVKDLPRDAARSAEIVKMALQAAEDIHLPAGMQGKGLAR